MIDGDHPAVYFEAQHRRSSDRTRQQSGDTVNNKRKLEYFDLTYIDLSAAQKKWVVDGIDGKNSNDSRWCELNIKKVSEFKERYGIKNQRIYKWRKRIKLGKPLLESSGGVTAITDMEREKIASTVMHL
jgi:hypothetical protein